MWPTGGRTVLDVGLVSRGGELAATAATDEATTDETSPVYECGDSSESTGDMVTELSGSPPPPPHPPPPPAAAFPPLALSVALLPPPLAPPTPVLTPGPSPPAGFFLLFAFMSFSSLAPPPLPPPPTFALAPPRRLFFPCGPGRIPMKPPPFAPHMTEELPPIRLGPLCGL